MDALFEKRGQTVANKALINLSFRDFEEKDFTVPSLPFLGLKVILGKFTSGSQRGVPRKCMFPAALRFSVAFHDPQCCYVVRVISSASFVVSTVFFRYLK